MPPATSKRSPAQLFAALGDDTRLKLIARLCKHGPQSITALAAGSQVTRQGITKHLRVMEKASLVHGTRRGREMVWELKAQRLEEARQNLEIIAKQWDKALEHLRQFVEN